MGRESGARTVLKMRAVASRSAAPGQALRPAGLGFPSLANFDPATGDGAENGCTNLRAFDADMTQSLDVVS
jgi:hypothetical protein